MHVPIGFVRRSRLSHDADLVFAHAHDVGFQPVALAVLDLAAYTNAYEHIAGHCSRFDDLALLPGESHVELAQFRLLMVVQVLMVLVVGFGGMQLVVSNVVFGAQVTFILKPPPPVERGALDAVTLDAVAVAHKELPRASRAAALQRVRGFGLALVFDIAALDAKHQDEAMNLYARRPVDVRRARFAAAAPPRKEAETARHCRLVLLHRCVLDLPRVRELARSPLGVHSRHTREELALHEKYVVVVMYAPQHLARAFWWDAVVGSVKFERVAVHRANCVLVPLGELVAVPLADVDLA
mmetsp:Transcript_9179/g.22867  ORF Transcript_9179/g.22867 Transcript_9179/m.22867 type:complete len:297 (-) Transcript_9179:1158-2048(-)